MKHAALRVWPYALFAMLFLAAGPARADCTNPAGHEKYIVYNGDFHTYQFCNGTNWMTMTGGWGSGGSGPGGMSLISTQTASNSASLQFTNLPTSYNTLFLNCTGLVVSAATSCVKFLVGEGAGPTWETSAKYTGGALYSFLNNGPAGWTGPATEKTGVDLTNGVFCNYINNNTPLTLEAYINNVASTTL